jgi:hypothetical protein
MSEENQIATAQGRPVGMVILIAIVIVGIAAIFWGRVVMNPQPEVFLFNAGPTKVFDVGEPRFFPSVRIYVIALDDDGANKIIRALDAIARGTGCTIALDPEDIRGAIHNPLSRNGTYKDPCSGGVWALNGIAITGTSAPLRTFLITRPQPTDTEGHPLIEIEVIGRPNPSATESPR